ncbi:MAG: DUF423 domain-containing protein [Candidatus Margulisiibacteriota bacterium]
MKLWIRIAGVLGFLGVALGAFGAHALKATFSGDQTQVYQTAVHYQLVHCLALLAYGVWAENKSVSAWPAWCFAGGIVVFSGSLYLLALTQIKWLGAITPMGGVMFLLGWIGLFVQAGSAKT